MLTLLVLPWGRIDAHPREVRFPTGPGPDETLRLEPLWRPRPILGAFAGPGGVLWALDSSRGLVVRSRGGTWHSAARAGLAAGATRLVRWGPDLVLLGSFAPPMLLRAGSWQPLWAASGPALGSARDAVELQGSLLVASSQGLFELSSRDLRPRPIELPARLIGAPSALASDGHRLVVATDRGGVALRDGSRWTLLEPGGSGPGGLATAAVAGAGKVVVGGPGRLEQWDLGGERRDLLAATPALGRPAVSDLALRSGELWVATHGSGVLLRRRGAWRQLVPPYVAMGSDIVHAVELTEDGAALVSTSHGLTRIHFEVVEPGGRSAKRD